MASSIPWLVQVGPAMPLRWQILWTNAPGAPLHKADGFAIETQNLRKVYGKKVAVRNLSLSVRCGEIFGFLGPNGAGKSTSIKMLLGLVKPTDGQALVLGAPSGSVEIRRKIGFLPEDFRFYTWLTASELLKLHGKLCGLSALSLAERVPALLELLGLTTFEQNPAAKSAWLFQRRNSRPKL